MCLIQILNQIPIKVEGSQVQVQPVLLFFRLPILTNLSDKSILQYCDSSYIVLDYSFWEEE